MSDPNGPSSPEDFPTGGQTPPPPPPPPGSVPPPPGSVPPPPGSVPPPPGGGHAPPPPGGGFVNSPQQPGYQQSQSGSSGVADAFQYGWTKFQQNIGNLIIAILVWVGVLIVAVVLSVLINAAFGATAGETITFENGQWRTSSPSFVGQLIASALTVLLMMAANFIGGMALIRVGLLTTKGEPITPSNLFSTDNVVPYVLTSLLVAVIVFVGSMLCFIPGYIAAFFLFFAPYFALDKGLAPLEALRASTTIVNRNIATTIVLLIGATIAYFIGALLCGIGLLVAFPVIVIAYGYMFRRFNGEPIAP